MPDLDLDTTTVGYQKLLTGLVSLKFELMPRLRLLKVLNNRQDKAKVQWLLQRDPLLRRTIKMAQGLTDFLDLEAEG